MGQIGNDFASHQIFDDYDKYNSRSDFSLIRMLKGTTLDTQFKTHWKNVSTKKAPYLVLKWYQSILDQVNKFYRLTMELASNFSLPPMIDVESLLLTPKMISQAFELSKSMFGNYPMPYSSKKFWPKAYPDYPQVPRVVANYPDSLVGLRYVGAETKIRKAMNFGFPTMPDDWGDFIPGKDFWQVSQSGVGTDWGLNRIYSKAIDVDYFDGTEEELSAVMDKWSNGGVVIPPPIPPTNEIIPIKEVEVISWDGLNIRSLDKKDSKDIGTLVLWSRVPVVEERGDWYRIEGYINKKYTRKS